MWWCCYVRALITRLELANGLTWGHITYFVYKTWVSTSNLAFWYTRWFSRDRWDNTRLGQMITLDFYQVLHFLAWSKREIDDQRRSDAAMIKREKQISMLVNLRGHRRSAYFHREEVESRRFSNYFLATNRIRNNRYSLCVIFHVSFIVASHRHARQIARRSFHVALRPHSRHRTRQSYEDRKKVTIICLVVAGSVGQPFSEL